MIGLMHSIHARAERTSIKINTAQDAPAANTWTYGAGAGTTTTTTTNTATPPAAAPTTQSWTAPPQTPTHFREPSAITLPPLHASGAEADRPQWIAAWRALDGKCFQTRSTEYVYELCPFRNVTQRGVSSSLHVILGLWGSWSAHDDAPFSQLYTDGNVCSSGRRRETEIRLICGASVDGIAPLPVVSNPAEPRGCAYSLDFTLPLACTDMAAPAVATVSSSSLSQCRSELTTLDTLLNEMKACISWLLADPTQQDATAPTPCTAEVLAAAGLTEQQMASHHTNAPHDDIDDTAMDALLEASELEGDDEHAPAPV